MTIHLASSLYRFEEDETSPNLCDPYNAEDFSYCILSKPLVKSVAKK